MKKWIALPLSLLGCMFLVSSVYGQAQDTQMDIEYGVTKPSQESAMPFVVPGIVMEVMVKEGQPIQEGQPMMKLDDRIERETLEHLEREAASEVRVTYAKQDLELKTVRLKIVKDAPAGTFSALEMDERQAEWNLAFANHEVAKLDHLKAQTEARQQKVKVEWMTLSSPYEGVVHKIINHKGEAIDTQKPSIAIVDNTPLHVEVNMEPAQAAALKLGDELQVSYPGSNVWKKAKITYMAPLADPISRQVKLELDNSDGRESGLQILVQVPKAPRPQAAAAR